MPVDQPDAFVKHQTATRDAFLGGRLTVSQPRHGFRAGLDSVLLGAAVGFGAGTLLDLGAGVGTAAFVAMTFHPRLSAVLVEREETALALAHRNAADNGFAARARVVALDLPDRGPARRAAGIPDNAFDCVIANPPFFAGGRGTPAPDVARAGARHMAREQLDDWVKVAAGAAAAGGEVIFIYPAEHLLAVLVAFDRRFGAVTVLPLLPRPGADASRILVRGTKGSRAPLRLLAGRALHDGEGRDFRPEFDAIFRGQARLDW